MLCPALGGDQVGDGFGLCKVDVAGLVGESGKFARLSESCSKGNEVVNQLLLNVGGAVD